MNKFELRQALRRQPGMYQAGDLLAQYTVKRNKLYRVLKEMEKDGEVVRWGSHGGTRWQILEQAQGTLSRTICEKWNWPDVALWPVEAVPLGYAGR